MMVYASDFHFLETALHMFGVNVFTKGVQVSQSVNRVEFGCDNT
jgi:acyl-CoA thioesterase